MTDSTTCSPRPAHTEGPWRISDNPYGAIVSDHPTGRIGEEGYTTDEGLYFPGDVDAYGGYVICESVLARNKPLIAAAPELFDSLRFVEAWIAGDPLPCLHKDYHRPGDCPEANQARSREGALARIRDLLGRIEEAEVETVQGAEA
jgi:hypothetical protein